MNQILVSEKLYVTPDMKKKKKADTLDNEEFLSNDLNVSLIIYL